MPSERIAACFRDILESIRLIETWVDEAASLGAAVLEDMKARSAIERQLLIISEAAVRMHKLDPQAAPQLAPGIDWQGIRGIGNFIRHKYDDLDTSILSDVIRTRLRPLHDACADALRSLGN